MLDRMKKNLAERGVTNVEMVLGSAEDPHLPVGEVDLVLIVDVYHELQHPEKTMEHVRRSLKPIGRVVLIEYRREDPNIPINPLHKMSVEEVRGELEPMGFRLAKLLDFLPTQHIFIFQDALRARQ
jgi:ubiquinone/menaquinone biosynthesis C-methylase UbiE